MIEAKNNWDGGLNLDDSLQVIPKNAYIDALNITRNAVTGSAGKVITNVVGNRLVSYTFKTTIIIDTSTQAGGTGYTQATAAFSGIVSAGTIVNMYLYQQPNTEVFLATYTVIQGDTIGTVITAIEQYIAANYGSEISFYTVGNSIVYTYKDSEYRYDRTEVISTTTIGSYGVEVRNAVIEFAYHTAGYHSIIQYDNATRTRTKIFENLTDSNGVDVLGFTLTGKITSINVYVRDDGGDFLFWLDSLGRPSGIDIAKFQSGVYIPVTRPLLNKIKMPPLAPPQAIYANDSSTSTNNLTNKFFRFFYRWIYDDYETSVFSPISAVPIPVNILNQVYTGVLSNNNLINVSLLSGGVNVKKVELGMQYANSTDSWSAAFSVSTISMDSIAVNINTVSTDLGGGIGQSISTFSGVPTVGTVINMYLYNLPSTETLFATYTVASGDIMQTVITGLEQSIASLGIVTVTSTVQWTSFTYVYNNATYAFDRTQVIVGANVVNTPFNFAFYNDAVYPTIDPSEFVQLYDYVPDKALAQGMPDGNVLTYGGITEGYDKNTVENAVITFNTTPAGTGGGQGSLSVSIGAIIFGPTFALCPATFTGIPAIGTVITLQIRRRSDGVLITGGTYTTVDNTINSILSNFTTTAPNTYVSGHNTTTISFALDRSTYEALVGSNNWITFTITPPSTTLNSNVLPTWRWNSQRNIARAYFDQNGKTNGILYTDKVVFPDYSEGTAPYYTPNIDYIDYKIYDVPPIWAYSMNFYFTKNNDLYKWWQSDSVQVDTNYIYLEVTSLITNAAQNPTTAIVCSYSFTAGDRLRLIRDVNSNLFYNGYDISVEGLVVTPTINGVVQPTGSQFIKIKFVLPFVGTINTAHNYVFELYTPTQQIADAQNQVYYEFARQYPILNPGTPQRSHAGQLSDQVLGISPAEYHFNQGDSYFRLRTITTDSLGSYKSFYVIDANIVDKYISAVSSVDGRANLIDPNARQQFFGATIRFSQSYQANTSINGLNRFYYNNLMDLDYSYGNIVAFRVRDRYMKAFQQLKVGTIPLYSQLTKDPSGNNALIVSDKLLNPVQYRIGNFGLTQATSLASWHFADYGCDGPKGVIWRDSDDGILPISVLYKVNSFALANLPLRIGTNYIYGAIDPKLNQYILALETTGSSPAQTLNFSEDTNSFESFLSWNPENMVVLGNLLITFKNGQLYTHDNPVYNNFYGVQYSSTITMVFNEFPLSRKSYQTIQEIASDIWHCPEIKTSLISYGVNFQESNLVTSDFEVLEGGYNASFYYDTNSIGGLVNGDSLKGFNIQVKFQIDNPVNLVTLTLCSILVIDSPLNQK